MNKRVHTVVSSHKAQKSLDVLRRTYTLKDAISAGLVLLCAQSSKKQQETIAKVRE